MGEEEEEAKKVELEPAPEASSEEKAVIPPKEEAAEAEAEEEFKALAIEPLEESKSSGGSINRDAVLARVETEKRMSLIKAWEENEKTIAENKAIKKISAVGAWENTKKASVEAKLKQIEEKLEKQKAEYAEQMKNKIAIIHKEAEERRAMIEAKKGEDLLKAEEMAAKYRATGLAPKKLFGCIGAS